MKNKFGLNRSIPEKVKRDVRQRCGFGCVVCVESLIEYEHFSPEFHNARSHDANGITLLCPTCHAKKTRNQLSMRKIRECNANPAAKIKNYAHSELEGYISPPYIKFAGLTLKNCKVPLKIKSIPALQIEAAENENEPYRLSATFFNSSGLPSLLIRQNEWQAPIDSWDVEHVGPNITIRTGLGEIALKLIMVPGEGLIVERLEMLCAGYRLSGNSENLSVIFPHGGKFDFTNCVADGGEVGLMLG